MPEALQNLIPYLIGGMLSLALVLFLTALYFFRQGRRDPYWRRRRAASLRGWQLFLVSLTVSFVASAVCLFTGFAELVFEGFSVGNSPTLTPTEGIMLPTNTPIVITATSGLSPIPDSAEASETPLLMPTTPPLPSTDAVVPATSVPTVASPTFTLTPTTTPSLTVAASRTPDDATPTASPTSTPTFTLALTPMVSGVTPRPEASLRIAAVDSAVSDALTPVNPRTTFEAGLTRLYFWVTYEAMTDGAGWARLLIRDGRVIQGGSYLWGAGEAGTVVYFFGDSEGFAPGEYELRLLLGNEQVSELVLILE